MIANLLLNFLKAFSSQLSLPVFYFFPNSLRSSRSYHHHEGFYFAHRKKKTLWNICTDSYHQCAPHPCLFWWALFFPHLQGKSRWWWHVLWEWPPKDSSLLWLNNKWLLFSKLLFCGTHVFKLQEYINSYSEALHCISANPFGPVCVFCEATVVCINMQSSKLAFKNPSLHKFWPCSVIEYPTLWLCSKRKTFASAPFSILQLIPGAQNPFLHFYTLSAKNCNDAKMP